MYLVRELMAGSSTYSTHRFLDRRWVCSVVLPLQLTAVFLVTHNMEHWRARGIYIVHGTCWLSFLSVYQQNLSGLTLSEHIYNSVVYPPSCGLYIYMWSPWMVGLHNFKPHTHQSIMAYSSTPYVGMTQKKNCGHIKSAQITRSKCRCKISQRLPWAL